MSSKKIAFVFPGVGSQYSGMCESLYSNFKIFKDTIDEASDILHTDMSDLMLAENKAKSLSELTNAQCALVAAGYATFRVFMSELGILPDYCMGHSLGEYSALCCAGMISYSDALNLVTTRGKIITEASKKLNGTMVWVVNVQAETVNNLCAEVRAEGMEVYVSAYDSSTQTAISGSKEAIEHIAPLLEKLGAIMYPLKLSGPFHSPLMQEAAAKMQKELENCTYSEGNFKVVANYNAKPYEGFQQIPDYLMKQLVNPIHWKQSLDFLIEQNVIHTVEMGPKSVLKFLIEQNTNKIVPFSLNEARNVEELTDKLVVNSDSFISIIGECLGTVVSSRNYIPDNPNYEQEVVKPYNTIKSIYDDSSKHEDIQKDTVRQVISSTGKILEAKKIPAVVIDQKLDKILNGKYLV